MELTVIKIGGSVVTDKKSDKPKVNSRNLQIIANQLRYFEEPFILIHGAGSYGHPLAKKSGIDKGIVKKEQLVAMAETQRLQNVLNSIFCKTMIEKGIPAFPIQASSQAIMENGRLSEMDVRTIAGLVKMGIVPICYGVPAYDKKMKCSILSGDQIAPYLAKKLGAKRIIEACDVEGIFTTNPKKDKAAELINNINRENYEKIVGNLNGSLATDVTGGMKQKYLELIEAAKTGIVCHIVHFKSLKEALNGKPVGTTIDLNK